MNDRLNTLWNEQDGALSFEWIVLVTLLVIGIVGGVAATRDAIIDELGDASQGMLALDGSYTIALPLELIIDGVAVGGASDSGYVDGATYADCARTAPVDGQDGLLDSDS